MKTLDAPRKERWVEHRAALFANHELWSEMHARERVDAWPAETVDRCWRSLKSQRSASGSLPSTSIALYRTLPAALRAEAVAILRAHATQEERRYAFPYFDAAELTEEEREDTVAVPWNAYTREDDRTFADHLGRVSHLFTSVSATLRRRTVERALALPHPYDRHVALIHLVPVVEDVDRARIVPELERLTLHQPRWPTAKRDFEIFDDETMVRLVAHAAMQTCGWLLEDLIRHAHGRETASRDAICEAAIDNVIALSAQDVDEPLRALTPWMARRSAREVPRSIARRLTR